MRERQPRHRYNPATEQKRAARVHSRGSRRRDDVRASGGGGGRRSQRQRRWRRRPPPTQLRHRVAPLLGGGRRLSCLRSPARPPNFRLLPYRPPKPLGFRSLPDRPLSRPAIQRALPREHRGRCRAPRQRPEGGARRQNKAPRLARGWRNPVDYQQAFHHLPALQHDRANYNGAGRIEFNGEATCGITHGEERISMQRRRQI